MKKLLSIFLCLALLLSLSACGSSTSAGYPGAIMDGVANSPSESMRPGFSTNTNKDYATGGGWDAITPSAPETLPAPEPGEGGELVSSSLPENIKMIYRGYLYLESTDFDSASNGIESLVSQVGGYFESKELSNYSPYRSVHYVVRVPSAKYNEFCAQVGTMAQMNSQRHTAENISEEYYDVESRLATQRTKLDRLQMLLEKADKMEDIITLESAIAETELQVEWLTGSLRKYDSLVDYATVQVNLEEVYALTEQEEPAIGFWAKLGEAFKAGTNRFIDNLEDFAIGFARNWVGAIFRLCFWAVVIFFVVRKVRKGKKLNIFKKKDKTPPPPPPTCPDEIDVDQK